MKKAFTLIELLVVIAIIAILAAILFPVFARARENARRSSCQSNLKQMGLAIIQYQQDYDEKYPPGRTEEPDPPASWTAWANLVQPYVKSRQIFQCPSNPTTMPSGNSFIFSGSGNLATRLPISYVASGRQFAGNADDLGGPGPMNVFSSSSDVRHFGGAALSQVENTAQVILVTEDRWGKSGNNSPMVSRADTFEVSPTNATKVKLQNHLGLSNYLFCDGHVKALKPTATGTPINMWNINNTTVWNGTSPGPAPTNLQTALAAQEADMS